MKKQLIVSFLAVVAVIMAGPSLGWAQKGPIKVGFLTPITGGGAAVGKDMSNGFSMYIEEISNQLAGRKVDVIIEDTQGDPAQALTKFRKLVESDNVHAVAGSSSRTKGTRSRRRWMNTGSLPFGPWFQLMISPSASQSNGWSEPDGHRASRTIRSGSMLRRHLAIEGRDDRDRLRFWLGTGCRFQRLLRNPAAK